MRAFTRRLSIVAAALIVGVCSIGVARGDKEPRNAQNVKNTGAFAVNDADDLELVFTGKVTNVKMTDSKGMTPTAGDLRSSADQTQTFVNWGGTAKAKIPGDTGTIPHGEFSNITWDGDGTINKSASHWTHGPTIENGTFASLGQPPSWTQSGVITTLTFTNPDSVAETYSSILAYQNNNLANLGTDTFYVPTGQLITGLPSSITLDPGQSMSLPLGALDTSGYDLVLSDVAATSDPTNMFFVAAAVSGVPEPSIPVLVVTGGVLGLLLHARRRVGSRAIKVSAGFQ